MYSVEGIIVGAKSWGEADKIIEIFSKEHGRIRAAAFGCRRPRSPLAGSLQLFSHVELQLVKGKRLDTVRQATRINAFRWVSEDLNIMAYASLVAELVREFFPEGEADEDFFLRLTKIMQTFKSRNPRIIALIAGVQILKAIGLLLSHDSCVHCGNKIESPAKLSTNEGGAICLECYNKITNLEGLLDYSLEVKSFLQALEEYDWDKNNGIIVKGYVLMQAEKIILNHIRGLVENPLQSLKFINQLG